MFARSPLHHSPLHRFTLRRLPRRLLASLAAIVFSFFALAGGGWAAVEVNSADPSQLESVKGIGPALSGKIVTERKAGAFKDWSDFEKRVSGVGEKNAVSFSRNGLTVAGKVKDGVQAAGDASHATKGSSKKAAADASSPTLAKK